MSLNKILLVLIILSGFLLIFYANNDIFTRPNIFTGLFRNNNDINGSQNSRLLLGGELWDVELADSPYAENEYSRFAHLKRIKYVPHVNRTEYNVFVIYTKETQLLQTKYELFLKSLLKYTTIDVHLHVVTDEKSELNAEKILKNQTNRYKKRIFYTLYDLEDCATKIRDIVFLMMPYFNSSPGSYYSDALFYLSLGLHKIVDQKMRRAILIDCDVVFRTDIKELFDQFRHFSSENLFGLAPELTPVYRHILYKYRAHNPASSFGSPFYSHPTSPQSRHVKHGYPGLNSGVVMLDFERIRRSKLFEESLKEEHIKKITAKYSFRGHLGDQDFFTLLGHEFPGLVFRLDCIWNRQLCTWWKEHGYSDVFDAYFHCEGKIRLYHGNCNTRIPE